MPYRKTKSLSNGRREEREKQLNIHRPIKSGIDSSSAVKVGSVQNDYNLKGYLKYWAGVEVRRLLLRALLPDFPLAGRHPECRPAEPTTKDLIRLQKGVVLCS